MSHGPYMVWDTAAFLKDNFWGIVGFVSTLLFLFSCSLFPILLLCLEYDTIHSLVSPKPFQHSLSMDASLCSVLLLYASLSWPCNSQ